jgi:hypothetical protein
MEHKNAVTLVTRDFDDFAVKVTVNLTSKLGFIFANLEALHGPPSQLFVISICCIMFNMHNKLIHYNSLSLFEYEVCRQPVAQQN